MRKPSPPGDGAATAAPSTLSIPEQAAAGTRAAMRLLATRERSRAELCQRLLRRGFHPDAVEIALDRLAGSGLQDDARFAEQYAAEAIAKGKAARLIQVELRGRAIGSELAAAAAAATPEDELERAYRLARARAARMRDVDGSTRARRIAGLLARRGFDAETCHRVAAEVAQELAREVTEVRVP